jgi:hypothetical protein
MVSGVGNGELLIVPQERDTGLSPWAGVTNTPTTFSGYGIVDVLGNLDDVNAPMPDDGDILTWDDIAGEWIAAPPTGGGAHDLDSHTDVNAPSPTDGQVLTWDNTAGEWIAADAGAATVSSVFGRTGAVVATAGDYDAFYYTESEIDALFAALVLDDLADVNAPTPSDGQVLTWDNGTSRWIPATPASGGTIDGSGTADFIPKWSDSDTLTDSSMADDGSAIFIDLPTSTLVSSGVPLHVNVGLELIRATNLSVFNMTRVNTSLASPSALLNADLIGRLQWRAHDGSALATGAQLEAIATENWSGSAHGAGFRFIVVENGGTSGAVGMTINHNGLISTPRSRAEGALTADMTGFTNSSTNLTNQSFSIGASEVWVFDFFGWLNTSGAGGCLFNFTVPSGCTGEFHVWGNGGNTSTIVSGRQATLTSNSPAAVNTGSGNDGHVHVRAILINSTTAGTIQLRGLSTAGGSTIVMRKGSHFTARRIS